MTELAGGQPVFITTSSKNGFKLTPQELESRIDRETKALLLNYPSNPTGASYTKKELLALNRVVQKHGLIVMAALRMRNEKIANLRMLCIKSKSHHR